MFCPKPTVLASLVLSVSNLIADNRINTTSEEINNIAGLVSDLNKTVQASAEFQAKVASNTLQLIDLVSVVDLMNFKSSGRSILIEFDNEEDDQEDNLGALVSLRWDDGDIHKSLPQNTPIQVCCSQSALVVIDGEAFYCYSQYETNFAPVNDLPKPILTQNDKQLLEFLVSVENMTTGSVPLNDLADAAAKIKDNLFGEALANQKKTIPFSEFFGLVNHLQIDGDNNSLTLEEHDDSFSLNTEDGGAFAFHPLDAEIIILEGQSGKVQIENTIYNCFEKTRVQFN